MLGYAASINVIKLDVLPIEDKLRVLRRSFMSANLQTTARFLTRFCAYALTTAHTLRPVVGLRLVSRSYPWRSD